MQEKIANITLVEAQQIIGDGVNIDVMSLGELVEELKNADTFKRVLEDLEENNKFLFSRHDNAEAFYKLFCKEYGLVVREKPDVKQEEDLDFEFLIGLFPNWGYIDVYYVETPAQQILITELTVSKD